MSVRWDPLFFERSPLFAAITPAARALAHHGAFPAPEELDAALAPLAGVRFVRQAPRARRARRTPRDRSAMYDARITLAGEVPTRPGSWHDLLNALVWATFPRAKRALHARQHRLVVPGAPARSRALDALALFDEGGVVVASDTPLDGEAAVANGVLRGQATLAVFGHAIYEGLALGWPSPIASVLVVRGRRAGGPDLDAAVAATTAELEDPRDLTRLPLGLPTP